MGATGNNMAYDTATHMQDMLTELWQAIDAGTEYDGQDAREYLDELPLEIVWQMGEPFAVVLATGGPHVEITGGGRQAGYALHVYWGDKSTVSNGAIARTGEYFRELAEGSYATRMEQ